MTLAIRKKPEDTLLELGGGAAPLVHPKCLGGQDLNVDVRFCQLQDGRQCTDFTADFNEPLPISSNEQTGIICQYAIEHISYRNVRQFISEMFRILKPGGYVTIITANTAEQCRWVLEHTEGWDGKPYFDSASGKLFGDLDYPENSHKSFFSPEIIHELFMEAGFENIVTLPWGARNTDLVLQASKPETKQLDDAQPETLGPSLAPGSLGIPNIQGVQFRSEDRQEDNKTPPEIAFQEHNLTIIKPAAELFDAAYFDVGGMGGYQPLYLDFPYNEIVARHVLTRKPGSVIEFGAGRGYVGKRLEDADVYYLAVDVSKHCEMTRACKNFYCWDLTHIRLGCLDHQTEEFIEVFSEYDLCFSLNFLEHIAEKDLPIVIENMEKFTRRGLHGIMFEDQTFGRDKTLRTLKPKSWWQKVLPEGHEVFDANELKAGDVPPEVYRGDGKIKLHIGSHWNMVHHGWQNIDISNVLEYAIANRYHFRLMDVRNGIPYKTGEVDFMFMSHFLEHLTYQESLSFLRECRRVLNTKGIMRIIVPDADKIIHAYVNENSDLDQINAGCANAPTHCVKMWEMLHSGHGAAYDLATLKYYLEQAGFVPVEASFRNSTLPFNQILQETNDTLPCESLYIDAVPLFTYMVGWYIVTKV